MLVAAASGARRQRLEQVVRECPVLQLGGCIASLASLRHQFREIHPDVVLVDLETRSAQFLNDVRALPTPASIVLLITEPDAVWSARALRAGVRAILERDAASDEIRSAIEAAHLGIVTLDPELALEFASRVRSDSIEPAPEVAGDLTAREVEVLRMLAEGLANKEIAAQLGVTDHTIKFHISSILGKLGAATRTEAVTLGVRRGLISL